MTAKELYDNLDDYFIKPGMSDDWFQYMPELEPFLCDNFKERNMGLACDFTETIHKVYTAVFPSENVLRKVLNSCEEAMLFVHHASSWDLKNDWSAAAHELPANNRINIFGGTHYSNEKFACMAMCTYFKNMGIPAEFVEDEPCFEDM